jgi:hypothetical protein
MKIGYTRIKDHTKLKVFRIIIMQNNRLDYEDFHNREEKWYPKIHKMYAANANPIMLQWEQVEGVDSFLYLGSIIDKQGCTEVIYLLRWVRQE